MLSRILVDGYKSIDRSELELSNFTLLAGVNSAGKSSVIQAVMYVTQAHHQYGRQRKPDIGRFMDIRNSIKGNREIYFELDLRRHEKKTTVKVILTQKENGVGMDLQQPSGFSLIDFIQRNKIVYLPVERVGIMRTYELNTQQERIIGERGEYAYSYLALYGQESIPAEEFAYKPEEVGQSLNNQVNYWLEYLMGFNVQTNIVQDVDQVVVTYSNAKSNRYYRGKNVGTGVTYMSILVIAALACKQEDILIIENPEIHLHPRAQSRFMEFLAFLANRGLQVIVETHSDHIYNGMRKCIKRNTLDKEKAAAYFFELDNTMQTRVERIRLNDEGAEENHPYGMFDQFDDDLDELLGL